MPNILVVYSVSMYVLLFSLVSLPRISLLRLPRDGPGASGHDLSHIINLLRHGPIPVEKRAVLSIPILIFAGGDDMTFPLKSAQEWQNDFTSGSVFVLQFPIRTAS